MMLLNILQGQSSLYQPYFSLGQLLAGIFLLVVLLTINKLFFALLWTKDVPNGRMQKNDDKDYRLSPLPLDVRTKKTVPKAYKITAFLLAIMLAFQFFASLLLLSP